MTTNKKGRPTASKKDTMLRIRIDSETLNKLDECVKVQNNNRSEVVRNGINEQYDKIKK